MTVWHFSERYDNILHDVIVVWILNLHKRFKKYRTIVRNGNVMTVEWNGINWLENSQKQLIKFSLSNHFCFIICVLGKVRTSSSPFPTPEHASSPQNPQNPLWVRHWPCLVAVIQKRYPFASHYQFFPNALLFRTVYINAWKDWQPWIY